LCRDSFGAVRSFACPADEPPVDVVVWMSPLLLLAEDSFRTS
jgi:hypothetical protein